MAKHLFLVLIAFVLFPFTSVGQWIVDGYDMDSTMQRFTTDSIPNYIPDTASIPLWQIGTTYKPFFMSGSFPTKTIMTDTLNNYPINANNSFVLKIPAWTNLIVDFWHKYQTDAGNDGGIVEFSLDNGINWQNVKGACNSDSFGWGLGGGDVFTANFYTFNDTLKSGEPAFTGIKDTVQYSRFQFFTGFPVKPTSGGGCSFSVMAIYVRFRFVSDSTTDTLAGWRIDSMKIERDIYPGNVRSVHNAHLPIFPNPSNGIINFPKLEDEEKYTIAVYNYLGEKVANLPYAHSITLPERLPGLYFYRVTNGLVYYSGQLRIE
jgi:hypothetical protein